MPGNTQLAPKTTRQQSELLDLIPRPHLLPGENTIACEDLRAALLLEFAPTTPYQTVLAENLVALEWEIHRYRRMRDSLIRTRYRTIAQSTWVAKNVVTIYWPGSSSEEATAFADSLLSPDAERSADAYDWLAERNIDPAELVAAAYNDAKDALAPLERMLAELETRRRLLRKDYDQLHSTSAAAIEDATLLADE